MINVKPCIYYENTTKIKPIARGNIKLSIVICHHMFLSKNGEIWLTYIGEVDICSSTQVKLRAIVC